MENVCTNECKNVSFRGGIKKKSTDFMLKIQMLFTLVVTFTMSMVFGMVAHATGYEPIKRDVNDLTIRFLNVGNSGVYEWTGEQIKPSVGFVDANGSSIVVENSLRVEYGANVEPGKGTITITGLGDDGTDWKRWYGTKTFEFTITKADVLNVCGLSGYDEQLVASLHSKNDGGTFIKGLFNSEETSFIKSIKNKTYSSSNKNIFTVKNGKITYKGIGIAYLNVNIPETNYTLAKQFKFKITVEPQMVCGNIWSKNGKLNIHLDDEDMAKSKTSFKYRIEIYKNRSYKKKDLVKSKTLDGKKKAKGFTQTFKGLEKGKNYWVKIYSYKKIDNKTTLKSGAIKTKVKIK